VATASLDAASPGPGALAFRWLFFPFTLGLSLWLAHELWQAWQAPGSVIGLSSLAAIALIALCERLAPHRSEWNESHGDVVTDVAHNFVTSFGFTCPYAWLKMYLLENIFGSFGKRNVKV